ncbi:MAG: DNA polymerase III subunit alpha [Rubricoccaceae bacterium]|nr:DNA polymerase III subunit alpha [Rubricoccaceae bacterium]
MFVHLHARSWFSFRAGGSSPEAIARAAAAAGQPAVALTDRHGVYGAVRFAKACLDAGVRPLYGAEVVVDGHALILLAGSNDGYEHLCHLLTRGQLRSREAPAVTLDELAHDAHDLWCLTGTDDSRLWDLLDHDRPRDALHWAGTLHDIFGPRLSVELAHRLVPGDDRRITRLLRLAQQANLPTVATNDVRHASREDYWRYDLLSCIREGLSVFEPHPARPTNAERFLADETTLRRRLPLPAALARACEIADACHVQLITGEVTPPAARLPPETDAATHLRTLCERGLAQRYGEPPPGRAREQLEHELAVITGHDLDEYFLVVHEVTAEARRRGIRCAGRGSAANSIVAYLLGITNVDPLAHRLLFERFLHRGRASTPDIDVDFDAERREEIIDWIEQRFGISQTAMTATVITYRLRSALRDAAKALGWPMDIVNRLGKAVPHAHAAAAPEHRVAVEQVVGPSPLAERLLQAAAGLEGCPRHLGQHSGGMVLSRTPLRAFTPVQVSANGVKVVQFDKDDVEALGLVKLDVLALRMLATVSEAAELVERHEGVRLDLDALPLDDTRTFNLIRAGRTLGCFQIESQGQLHLLAQAQPESFDDLITEIALFRPGPLQGNMVHPFVQRRRGNEPVAYDDPSLEPVLRDTYGVILFQEQVLEVAHAFAGMPLEEADAFRRLMSKFRSSDEMESMRGRFVAGAVGRGVPEPVAQSVFDRVSKFVGYGFCRSHAAAFAQTVYQSCYLKAHHPAAFMAAVMQHRPGMYSLMTLQEEARRCGVQTHPPDLARSGPRYDLEPHPRGWAIRMPLAAVRGLDAEDALALVWERLRRPFADLEDLWRRAPLGAAKLESLAQSGALDSLAASSRDALWTLGVLARRLGPPGQATAPTLFSAPVVDALDVPDLPPLTEAERLSWDLETHGAARYHPVRLVRRQLTELEIRPIATTLPLGRLGHPNAHPRLRVAGIVMLRQRPPTAKGVMFLTLEDETGFVQCVVRPEVLERLDWVLRQGALIVEGRLHSTGNWRGLVLTDAWPLHGIFGGYSGHPDWAGGRDTLITAPDADPTPPPEAVPA